MLTAAFVGDPPERGGGVDLDGDGIPDDLEFAFEDDPTYYRRGDPSWDTDEEKLTKRRKLRRSFKIQGALIKFWSLFGVSPENTVPFESYAEVHRKITSVLAPEMSDRESAEAAKEDWNDDTEGASEISLAQFARGLFSVADLWTETCDEADYVEFLTKLLARISVRSAHTGRRTLAKSTRRMGDDVRSDVASLIAVLGAQGACIMSDDTSPSSDLIAAAMGASVDTSPSWCGGIGPGGMLLDANGKPILGADGRPLTLPPCTIGPGGVVLDADGNPVIGADGKTIAMSEGAITDPRLLNDPRIPPGGSIGPGGIILDADGNPVLGVDGKPLYVGDGKAAGYGPEGDSGYHDDEEESALVRCAIGPGGMLLDANGKPILGADGRPLTLPPCTIGPGGVVLDADGNPVIGADGKTIAMSEGAITDPRLLNDPRIPPGGSIGPGGIILDADGNPVLGVDGKPLYVGDGRAAARTTSEADTPLKGLSDDEHDADAKAADKVGKRAEQAARTNAIAAADAAAAAEAAAKAAAAAATRKGMSVKEKAAAEVAAKEARAAARDAKAKADAAARARSDAEARVEADRAVRARAIAKADAAKAHTLLAKNEDVMAAAKAAAKAAAEAHERRAQAEAQARSQVEKAKALTEADKKARLAAEAKAKMDEAKMDQPNSRRPLSKFKSPPPAAEPAEPFAPPTRHPPQPQSAPTPPATPRGATPRLQSSSRTTAQSRGVRLQHHSRPRSAPAPPQHLPPATAIEHDGKWDDVSSEAADTEQQELVWAAAGSEALGLPQRSPLETTPSYGRPTSAPPTTTTESVVSRRALQHCLARHSRDRQRIENWTKLPASVLVASVPNSPRPSPHLIDGVPTRRMAADADGTLQTRRLPPHYKQHRWEPRYVEPAWVPSHVRRAAHPHAPPNPSPVPAQRPASPPIPRREMEKKVWSPMWKGSSVKEAWQGWIGSAAGNMAHRSAPISPRKLSDLLDPKPPPRQALRDELRRCLLQGRSEEEVRVEKDLTVAVLRRAL